MVFRLAYPKQEEGVEVCVFRRRYPELNRLGPPFPSRALSQFACKLDPADFELSLIIPHIVE